MGSKISCDLNVEEQEKKLTVNLSGSDIVIDYSSDIDFTKLVSELTKKIDEAKEVELKVLEKGSDDKTKLIIETVKDIIELYNNSLKESDELELAEK